MRKLKGTITSDKMMKTVVVRVDRLKKHAKYQKYFKTSQKFKAHNEGDAKAGDVVIIEETRPLSKDKRWRVVEIVKKGVIKEEEEEIAEPSSEK
ncbi:MAG: 30S ribosomal protein S17 [bacterium]|nr:30S ribosomal protein S17 [bacterium]